MNVEFGDSEEASQMIVETNDYYDETCGIGAHGDTERRRVCGLRLGASNRIGWRWRIRGKGVGVAIYLTLNHGDMYIMSAKAVGSDWKHRSKLTIVHAAGAKKYMDQLNK